MRVFVAGASGAVGEPLIAELLKRGHSVVGMTTNEMRGRNLVRQGAEARIVNAFDAEAVEAALRDSQAEVVIDELASLPKELGDMPKYAAGDRKLHLEGEGNLLRAAIACGARRYLQQSCGFFLKSAKATLADEPSPLDVNASPGVAASARTYRELETRLLGSNAIKGVALRYGFFYGPKTWYHPGEAAATKVAKQIRDRRRFCGIQTRFAQIHPARLHLEAPTRFLDKSTATLSMSTPHAVSANEIEQHQIGPSLARPCWLVRTNLRTGAGFGQIAAGGAELASLTHGVASHILRGHSKQPSRSLC